MITNIEPTPEQRERTAAIVAAHKGKKFTNEGLHALKATGVEYGLGDAGCEGLRLRVSAAGVKTFVYTYRSPVALKTRALKIGQFPDITLARARLETDKARAAVKEGHDPQSVKLEEREATKNAVPFREVRDRFVAAVLVTQRAGKHRTDLLERTSRRFGWSSFETKEGATGGRDIPFASITVAEATAHIERLRDGLSIDPLTGKTGGGKIAAFAAMSILRELFKWAKRKGFIEVNIFADLEVDGVRKPPRRTRTLTTAEIRAVWAALDTPEKYGMSHDAATAIRVIFATAARPGMVCGMVAGELADLDVRVAPSGHLRLVVSDSDEVEHDGPVWIIPHERMKRTDKFYPHQEPFIIPLNPLAVRLIKSARGDGGDRVFGPSAMTGKQAMMTNKLAGCVRRLVKALGMKRWTPHDARRTAASLLSAAVLAGRGSFADHEIGWLMAHKAGQVSAGSTTGIYTAGNERFDEKRHMSGVLGINLEKCIRDERIGLDRARYKRAA